MRTLGFALALTLAACSSSTFDGMAGQTRQAEAKKNGTGNGNGPSDTSVDQKGKNGSGDALTPDGSGGQNVLYVPLGGTKPLPGGGGAAGGQCTPADDTIATCKGGVVTGTKLGQTTVTSGAGGANVPSGLPGAGGDSAGGLGTKTTVIVYDPKNPPPGALNANGGGADGSTDSGNGGLGTGNGTLGGPGSIATDDATLVANIPGIPVLKVGVNFEDQEDQGDKDYNDSVTCFQGKFKVDNTNVVSTENQTVTALVHSISGCHNFLRIDIIHPDGTQEPEQIVDAPNTPSITLNFKVGSRLEVYERVGSNCKDPGAERNMHTGLSSIPDAKVLPDLCNVTGN